MRLSPVFNGAVRYKRKELSVSEKSPGLTDIFSLNLLNDASPVRRPGFGEGQLPRVHAAHSPQAGLLREVTHALDFFFPFV